jgi:aldose 1-epimerase
MSVTRHAFGVTPDGVPVELYTLASGGLEATIATYGGILVALRAPDRRGILADVTLGFDELAPYLTNEPYFGALIGRYGNRIAGGRFQLDGATYTLARNNGPNHLHGGPRGFHTVVWSAEPRAGDGAAALTLRYTSPDGEEGYPGTLAVAVTYTLAGGELRLDYTATTDRATVVNLTNHTYFNLAGAGDILGHELRLLAGRFLPVDATLIPTGELRPVAGTPMDFTRPAPIGARLDAADEQLRRANGGYDHCWALDSGGGALALAAEVFEPASGRTLQVLTTQPGVQFYTGNFLDGRITGKGGRAYAKHAGFCLETQHFPDSPNQPAFPTTVLRPGETYRQTTIFRLGVRA